MSVKHSEAQQLLFEFFVSCMVTQETLGLVYNSGGWEGA